MNKINYNNYIVSIYNGYLLIKNNLYELVTYEANLVGLGCMGCDLCDLCVTSETTLCNLISDNESMHDSNLVSSHFKYKYTMSLFISRLLIRKI